MFFNWVFDERAGDQWLYLSTYLPTYLSTYLSFLFWLTRPTRPGLACLSTTPQIYVSQVFNSNNIGQPFAFSSQIIINVNLVEIKLEITYDRHSTRLRLVLGHERAVFLVVAQKDDILSLNDSQVASARLLFANVRPLFCKQSIRKN